MKASLFTYLPNLEEDSAVFMCRFSHLLRESGVSCLSDEIESIVCIEDTTDFYAVYTSFFYNLGLLDGCSAMDLPAVFYALRMCIDKLQRYLVLIDLGLRDRVDVSLSVHSERYMVDVFLSDMLNAFASLGY